VVDLSIVIVNWNVKDLLRPCLHSLLDRATLVSAEERLWQTEGGLCFEVLVIDSASSDGSVDVVRNEFPHVHLYASETNLGYSGGNNLGLGKSQGEYILLLNPDTEVLDSALDEMVSYMRTHPRVGVVGPQLRYPDGEIQSSRRRFPGLATALVESTFLEKWMPRHRVLARYRMLDCPDDEVAQVDWLVGACLLVRAKVRDQVGVLDDQYFMYSEELDWQKRIREAGWTIVYLPSARIIHYEGKSSEQVGALTHIRFSRSKVRYFCRHHGWLAGRLVQVWLLLNYVYECGIESAKWFLGHKRSMRQSRIRAYVQVLRDGLWVR
jgi:N-acetylglucosaminyl-diphospho-decaprenol L-rhamnosyltransferase